MDHCWCCCCCYCSVYAISCLCTFTILKWQALTLHPAHCFIRAHALAHLPFASCKSSVVFVHFAEMCVTCWNKWNDWLINWNNNMMRPYDQSIDQWNALKWFCGRTFKRTSIVCACVCVSFTLHTIQMNCIWKQEMLHEQRHKHKLLPFI